MVASVLVVDDEPAIRKVVTSALSELGCEDTFEVGDAESAMEIIERRRPDVVITDVKLPGMSGVDLARIIKESSTLSSIPVFLMSAFGEPVTHVADGFLPKPFSMDDLVQLVGPKIA